jgi:omega-6 fatty acid desaturase (delta-12 desaturase)
MAESATSTLPAPGAIAMGEGPSWRQALAAYARPHLGRSLLDIATSVVPFLGLSVAMYFLLDVSWWLLVPLYFLAAGFLVRTYILFHDCAHGSFLPWSRANDLLGSACALLVFTPFARWRHQHAVHHATSGDLDRRGVGDVPTMTVAEYYALPPKQRLGYKLFRNPLVMFGIGPIWAMMVAPRMVSREERPRIRRSTWRMNVALVVAIGLLCWLVGWQEFLIVQFPIAWIAGAAGVWLFYVQHQFEDAYWQGSDGWSYDDAALRGSSYLKLPKILQFFSGNIGLHHVHHLSTRVPNYNLQKAHEAYPAFQTVPTLTFSDGMRCVRLKLYDESSGKMVGWREARETEAARAAQAV